jgi:glycosyltransferase involved in cell wall biosynthesis
VLVYFVNHSTAPVHLGGAERSLIGLVEEWYESDPDFEALFLTKAPRGKFIEAVEQRGWRYQAFRYRGWVGPSVDPPLSEITYFARDDYSATLEMIQTMEHRRPDLVVTNTLVAPWGAFAAATLGIPHAWFVREYGGRDHGLNFRLGERQTFEDIGLLSEAVFTNSLALKEHIGQYLDASKVSVVYPRIDEERLRRLAAEPIDVSPFPADAGLRITVVGRLSDSKGQSRMIEALALLAERGRKASLCLVGSSELPGYDGALMARAKELGVAGNVAIVGERVNPFPFVAAADIGATPSQMEAFGRTTLEYMLLGKAVVASTGGGSSELVKDDATGLLVDGDDIQAIAAALQRYADDPELALRHGRAARSRGMGFLGHEFSNAAAIERLKVAATLPAYRLPNAARSWFALPRQYFSMGAANPRITLSFIRTRLGGRVRRLLAKPVSALGAARRNRRLRR